MALRLQVHDFSGAGRYVLHFDFNDGAIEPRLRRRSLGHFETLLEAVIEDPDRPISHAIDVLVEDERQALAALKRHRRGPAAAAVGDRDVRGSR